MRMKWTIGVLWAAALCAPPVWAKSASIQENTKTCEIDLKYPVIGHPAIDGDVADWVKGLADEFRDSCKTAAKEGTLGPGGKYSVELTFEIHRNDAKAFSASFNYFTYTGGAHPNTQQIGRTYLKPDGRRVFIAELIGPKGLRALSAYAIADLKRQWDQDPMSDEDWVNRGAGPMASNYEDFAWTAKGGLVVMFSPYQVAAYAAGPQEVQVPEKVLKNWLRPDPRAPQPSFDCEKSRTAIEYAICGDWKLARADRQMAEDYAQAVENAYEPKDKRQIVAEQRAWLRVRNRSCEQAKDVEACVMPLIAQRRARIASRQE